MDQTALWTSNPQEFPPGTLPCTTNNIALPKTQIPPNNVSSMPMEQYFSGFNASVNYDKNMLAGQCQSLSYPMTETSGFNFVPQNYTAHQLQQTVQNNSNFLLQQNTPTSMDFSALKPNGPAQAMFGMNNALPATNANQMDNRFANDGPILPPTPLSLIDNTPPMQQPWINTNLTTATSNSFPKYDTSQSIQDKLTFNESFTCEATMPSTIFQNQIKFTPPPPLDVVKANATAQNKSYWYTQLQTNAQAQMMPCALPLTFNQAQNNTFTSQAQPQPEYVSLPLYDPNQQSLKAMNPLEKKEQTFREGNDASVLTLLGISNQEKYGSNFPSSINTPNYSTSMQNPVSFESTLTSQAQAPPQVSFQCNSNAPLKLNQNIFLPQSNITGMGFMSLNQAQNVDSFSNILQSPVLLANKGAACFSASAPMFVGPEYKVALQLLKQSETSESTSSQTTNFQHQHQHQLKPANDLYQSDNIKQFPMQQIYDQSQELSTMSKLSDFSTQTQLSHLNWVGSQTGPNNLQFQSVSSCNYLQNPGLNSTNDSFSLWQKNLQPNNMPSPIDLQSQYQATDFKTDSIAHPSTAFVQNHNAISTNEPHSNLSLDYAPVQGSQKIAPMVTDYNLYNNMLSNPKYCNPQQLILQNQLPNFNAQAISNQVTHMKQFTHVDSAIQNKMSAYSNSIPMCLTVKQKVGIESAVGFDTNFSRLHVRQDSLDTTSPPQTQSEPQLRPTKLSDIEEQICLNSIFSLISETCFPRRCNQLGCSHVAARIADKNVNNARWQRRSGLCKVIIHTPKVAQKSYGSEKRFLCPPPKIIVSGNCFFGTMVYSKAPNGSEQMLNDVLVPWTAPLERRCRARFSHAANLGTSVAPIVSESKKSRAALNASAIANESDSTAVPHILLFLRACDTEKGASSRIVIPDRGECSNINTMAWVQAGSKISRACSTQTGSSMSHERSDSLALKESVHMENGIDENSTMGSGSLCNQSNLDFSMIMPQQLRRIGGIQAVPGAAAQYPTTSTDFSNGQASVSLSNAQMALVDKFVALNDCGETMSDSWVVKQLYISDHEFKKSFECCVEVGRLGLHLVSKSIKVISKPSKKRASQSSTPTPFMSAIHSGSGVSLFNRIRSQTVSTKYLTVGSILSVPASSLNRELMFTSRACTQSQTCAQSSINCNPSQRSLACAKATLAGNAVRYLFPGATTPQQIHFLSSTTSWTAFEMHLVDEYERDSEYLNLPKTSCSCVSCLKRQNEAKQASAAWRETAAGGVAQQLPHLSRFAKHGNTIHYNQTVVLFDPVTGLRSCELIVRRVERASHAVVAEGTLSSNVAAALTTTSSKKSASNSKFHSESTPPFSLNNKPKTFASKIGDSSCKNPQEIGPVRLNPLPNHPWLQHLQQHARGVHTSLTDKDIARGPNSGMLAARAAATSNLGMSGKGIFGSSGCSSNTVDCIFPVRLDPVSQLHKVAFQVRESTYPGTFVALIDNNVALYTPEPSQISFIQHVDDSKRAASALSLGAHRKHQQSQHGNDSMSKLPTSQRHFQQQQQQQQHLADAKVNSNVSGILSVNVFEMAVWTIVGTEQEEHLFYAPSQNSLSWSDQSGFNAKTYPYVFNCTLVTPKAKCGLYKSSDVNANAHGCTGAQDTVTIKASTGAGSVDSGVYSVGASSVPMGVTGKRFSDANDLENTEQMQMLQLEGVGLDPNFQVFLGTVACAIEQDSMNTTMTRVWIPESSVLTDTMTALLQVASEQDQYDQETRKSINIEQTENNSIWTSQLAQCVGNFCSLVVDFDRLDDLDRTRIVGFDGLLSDRNTPAFLVPILLLRKDGFAIDTLFRYVHRFS